MLYHGDDVSQCDILKEAVHEMGYREQRLGAVDTIQLDDAVEGQDYAGYLAKVKHALSRAEIRRAEKAMTDSRQRTTVDGSKTGEQKSTVEWKMDMSGYNEQLVAIAIVEWNIDGECEVRYNPGNRPCQTHADGGVWPIDIEHVGALASADYATILKHVQANNRARSADEQTAFRAVGERDDHDGGEDHEPGALANPLPRGDVDEVRQD